MVRGYDRPLYVQPFDHRGSFQSGLFGWKPPLSAAKAPGIAAAKRIIYDKKATREQAVTRIAARYREFVDLFEED